VPIFFRGSGFYSTDYGRGSPSSKPKKKEKPKKEGDAGKDAAAKD